MPFDGAHWEPPKKPADRRLMLFIAEMMIILGSFLFVISFVGILWFFPINIGMGGMCIGGFILGVGAVFHLLIEIVWRRG